MPAAEFMRLALERAREGVAKGQTPFGACIVRDGRVVACEHNAVWDHTDSTAHAEVQAIRVACRRLGTVDLSGCEIYATCEPCPMCFSAIHWARISTILFGSRIADARGLGFSELTISNQQMKELGGSPVAIVPDYLREECAGLFREWAARPERRTY
jgi:tRNA(Arg) A34 adenosine deaminase TadA